MSCIVADLLYSIRGIYCRKTMKKALILTQEDISQLRRDINSSPFAGMHDQKPIREADIVLVQAEHNENYFAVLKYRDTLPGPYVREPQAGFYIHKVQVADFILGHPITLYNRDQTLKELDYQADKIPKEAQKCEIKKINALHRMELED
jgi:hypothetical protein